MRWDRLFDDIESQLERGLVAEEDDLAAEEERLRLARLTLRDRLLSVRATVTGSAVTLELRGVERTHLRITDVGRDWIAGLLLVEGRERSAVVVPFASIVSVGLGAIGVPDAPEASRSDLAGRLSVTFVLRDLARRRLPVTVTTDAGVLHGTIDRVGRDHLDLAVHPADVPRRASAVTDVRLLALARVLMISYAVSLRR